MAQIPFAPWISDEQLKREMQELFRFNYDDRVAELTPVKIPHGPMVQKDYIAGVDWGAPEGDMSVLAIYDIKRAKDFVDQARQYNFVQAYVLPKIIEDPNLFEFKEDWSGCRSRARAERRLRQGHPQRVRYVTEPLKTVLSIDGGRTLVVHPLTAAEIRRQLRDRFAATLEMQIQAAHAIGPIKATTTTS